MYHFEKQCNESEYPGSDSVRFRSESEQIRLSAVTDPRQEHFWPDRMNTTILKTPTPSLPSILTSGDDEGANYWSNGEGLLAAAAADVECCQQESNDEKDKSTSEQTLRRLEPICTP